MTDISIPYHPFIPCLICVAGLVLIILNFRKLFTRNKSLYISAIVFFIIYAAILGNVAFCDISYQISLNHFDLNQDGFFSGKEITAEQEKAMLRLTNDTGRNLAFITGFIFAFVISLPAYFIAWALQATSKKANTQL